MLGAYVFFLNSVFSNARTEIRNGREMILLDFTPVPSLASEDKSTSPAAHLAGTLWIDAQDRITTRIVARITPPTGAPDDTAFVQEFARMPEGVWLSTYLRLDTSLKPEYFNGEAFEWIRERKNHQHFTVGIEIPKQK